MFGRTRLFSTWQLCWPLGLNFKMNERNRRKSESLFSHRHTHSSLSLSPSLSLPLSLSPSLPLSLPLSHTLLIRPHTLNANTDSHTLWYFNTFLSHCLSYFLMKKEPSFAPLYKYEKSLKKRKLFFTEEFNFVNYCLVFFSSFETHWNQICSPT